MMGTKPVITWQTPRGQKVNVCPTCEARLTAAEWPRDGAGEEYCQVAHGLHEGQCDICQAEPDEED